MNIEVSIFDECVYVVNLSELQMNACQLVSMHDFSILISLDEYGAVDASDYQWIPVPATWRDLQVYNGVQWT